MQFVLRPMSALWLGLALLAPPPVRAVPLGVYGRLPSIEDVSISPDGTRLAFVRTAGETRTIQILGLKSRKLLDALRIGDQKLRSLGWADERRLLIVTSVTGMPAGMRGVDREWYGLQIYDLGTRRPVALPLLRRTSNLNLMNAMFGSPAIRRLDGHTVLFLHGFYVVHDMLPALIRVDLETLAQQVVRTGTEATRAWLVDAQGEVVAEQRYEDETGRWATLLRREGRLVEAAAGTAAIEPPRLMGFGPDGDALLLRVAAGGAPAWRLLSLQDGTLGAPVDAWRDFVAPIEDRRDHRMIGGMRLDDGTQYVFFDARMQARWETIVRAFGGDLVRYASGSEDGRQIVVRVDGPKYGLVYELVDLNTNKAEPIGDVYDGVLAPLAVRRIDYPAGDGLRIPAYLTLPPGRPARALALVVLPHGGPAARDTADFDWWSQALADLGYAVLRPNYRGSSVDAGFEAAGFGEFGRKMQTDLSDGVRYLAAAGIADPARVCIVGASYGGYAALAGVAFEPGVYRCAVSVAGISDLRRMLRAVDEKHQSAENLEQRFWDRYLGIAGPDDPLLASLSPIGHAAALAAPVLLIHGRQDTVVPYEQSESMFRALRAAGKDVRFVTLENEDHWLSHGDTRLEMLEATAAFLRAHNPPDELGGKIVSGKEARDVPQE